MDGRVLLVFRAAAAAAVTLAPACSSSSGGPGGGTPASNASSPPLLGEDCDPIEPVATDPQTQQSVVECGFPYPSNVWTVKDPSTPTGLHQFYGPTTLPSYALNKHIDPTPWARKDGFSPGSAIMAFWPDVDVSKLPNSTTVSQSVSTSSPTILMEYDTGKLVAHWDEIDMLTTTPAGERVFFMRPAVRLKDATRYLVAIRHLTDSTGTPIAPSPAFQALRDGTPSHDVSVGLRRDLYKDILGTLQKNGIDPSDLQMAWDFTTASKESTTSDMVSIRDQALQAVGKDGPPYKNLTITDNPNPYIRRRIEGTMTVPLYLTTPPVCTTSMGTEPGCPGSSINRDAGGKPAPAGTADYPFLIQIPNSVVNLGIQAPLLQNGHGLFGDRGEGKNGYMAEICDRLHYVEIAVDLVGMNGEDGNWIPNTLAGDLGKVNEMFDRLHQGFANELMAMRMMMGKMATDPATMPEGKPTIDPTHGYYRGDSQGGISGGVYMAISTDVTRGLLDNTGAPYGLLLDRSVDFSGFFLVIKGIYNDPVQLQLGIDLLQQLWDNAEPDGYLPYITDDPLPCSTAVCPSGKTPAHNVIIQDGIGDMQVTPLGAHFEARSVGARNLEPVNRALFGIQDAAGGFSGNGLAEFNFWLPASQSPVGNVPPPQSFPGCTCHVDGNPMQACATPDSNGNTCNDDPHDALRQLDSAQDMVDQFFRTGQIDQTCAGGACAAPMGWQNQPTLLTPADQIDAGTAPPDGGAPDGGADAAPDAASGDAGAGDASVDATGVQDAGVDADATAD